MPSKSQVLVLAPVGRDATIAVSILSPHQISSHICANLDEVLPLLDQSHCLVIAEEALINSDRNQFAAWLENQPGWSDFPVVLLTMRGTEFDKRLSFLDRYLIVLERPFLASSLANSVRSALRARSRQLEVKKYIEERRSQPGRTRLSNYTGLKTPVKCPRDDGSQPSRAVQLRSSSATFRPELCRWPTLIPCSPTTIGKRHRCSRCWKGNFDTTRTRTNLASWSQGLTWF